MKKMYDKYQKLQKALKNVVIRAKEGKYTDDNGDIIEGAVVIDITGENKVRDVTINDLSLLTPDHKNQLETLIKDAIEKAQAKVQEVATEKTKEILGFDPSQLGQMM
ncbi:MAG: YbaB/EbfC family nucleoid-associated protein [Candidatus Peribacteria bacterium]|nr:MAG: YbaB/EbfC family nucleoid-associated protein [Candidatus Peribacteria bacterium]